MSWKKDIFRCAERVGALTALMLCILAVNAHAKLNDVEALQEKALKENADRFQNFTKAKDVMGRGRTVDGKSVRGGEKDQMNKDTGGSYTDTVTYHSETYDKMEEVEKGGGGGQQGGGKEKTVKKTNKFIASHGKQKGDSSILERLMWGFHAMFADKEEKEKDIKEKEKKEGEREESAFIIYTKDAKPDDQGGQGGGGGGGKGGGEDAQVEKASRTVLKEEVQEAVKKDAGLVAFQNADKSAKDPENAEDPQAMGFLPLYYEAAQRAYDLWRNTAMAGLGQRRMYNAGKVKASESAPDCQSAVQQEIAEKLANEKDPARIQQIQKDAEEKTKNCEQVAKVDYREIAPVLVKEGDKEVLKSEGLAKEDGIQRDERVQIEVLDKYGITEKDVKANWEYKPEEFKSKIWTGVDEQGNSTNEVLWSGKEQLDSRNDQLTAADNAWEKVQDRLAGTGVADYGPINASRFKVEAGKQYAGDISKIPGQNRIDDFGAPPPQSEQEELPTTYDDNLKKVQEDSK